jgi:hypothetical protein
MADDEGQQGRWLRLRDAARSLRVSERTLRRRVQAGSAQGRQVTTPFGMAWEVWIDGGVDSADPAPTTPGGRGNGHADPALLEALQLVGRLQADYRSAEQRYQQQLMELSGRVGYLQAELTQARERILALEAPKTEPADVEPTAAAEATSEPATRPWWRRMWRAVGGV